MMQFLSVGRRTALALTMLSLSAAGLLLAEDRMRAGLWQLTSNQEGQPPYAPHNTCFTAAMVAPGNSPASTLRATMEKTVGRSGKCVLKDFKLEGNKVSSTTVCGDRTLVTVSTFGLDTFDTTNTNTEAGVKTISHIKGKRLGECK